MDYESKSTNREKGRGRGRGRKKVAENENKPQQITITADECNELEAITLDMDADITQLEAPTFSTINKGPPEPMLRLNWDHKTHLIGEKMISPMIHCCDKCEAPILIYGRMIPCKHVFCLTCAEQETKVCPRCQEKIVRIERSGLGTVFMCTFGGSRYGNTGCRRTYLSQRDLQAHINHRHVSGTSQSKENITFSPTIPSMKTSLSSTARSKTASIFHHTVAGDPRVQSNSSNDYFHKLHSPSAHSMPTSQHQSSRQQSHHHSLLSSHHPSKPSQSFPLHQHMNRSSQHHLSMPIAQQVMQQTDFGSPLMMSNYPQPSTHAGGVTSSSNVRSNLITVQIHDSNVDSIGIPIASGFPRPNFSSQFSQAPSSNMPFSRSSAWSIT